MFLDVAQSTQMVLREGFCEFTWGQPDPDLLPVAEMRRATDEALAALGPETLAYGAAEGARPLLAWIRARSQQLEGISVGADECIGTAGNSDAIDQVCTLFTKPGDIVLVESPTYHLALRIMRDHGLQLHAVPLDREGLNVDALKSTLRTLATAGTRPRLLYTIPTFHNPSGISLSADRRRALVEVAVEEGLLVLEDDVYRELPFGVSAPSSLFAAAPRGTVLRMGSFAKSLAPGLRLGWLNGDAAQLRRLVDGGLRDSGGSPNFYTGMIVAAVCQSGDFERHVSYLRTEYQARRDVLAQALSDHLPPGCRFTKPDGGFFIWVDLPEGANAEALSAVAEAHRVTFIPGSRFSIDGRGKSSLRLAFSQMKPEALVEGANRLGAAIRGSV